MKHLLAFLGERSGGLTKLLSTTEEIYPDQDLSQCVPYAPTALADENEWFFLDNISAREFSNHVMSLSQPFNSTSLTQLNPDKYDSIKYICAHSPHQIHFQKVLTSTRLKKKLLSISNSPVIENNRKLILINSQPDAIHVPAEDKIYFKDLGRIKSIFGGIESVYREATNEEVTNFLGESFIQATDDYTVDSVKVPNRKRIALAMDRLTNFSASEKSTVIDYIVDYCPEVPYSDGKFTIANEDDLKKVLFGIDERFYTTNIKQEKRLANAVISLES